MKRYAAISFGIAVILCSGALIQAQERVSMSAPIIRSTGEELILTVKVENFANDKSYRVGVAMAGAKAPDAKLELMKEDSPVNAEAVEFVQENTKGWWGVDSIKAKGYNLGPAGLPEEGLTMRVTIPKDVADGYEKLYLFISRDYGSGRWYLEDGTELAQSDW